MITTGTSRGVHADVREEHRRVVELLEVDPRVGKVVAARERAERHGLGRVPRADDADRARAGTAAQDLAPRDQRAEDRVGELGPGAHEIAEDRKLHGQDATRLRDPGRQERALLGEEAELADEAVRSVHHDDHVGAVALANDLDLAVEHHEEVPDRLTGPVQNVAGLDLADDADLSQLVDGRVVERDPRGLAPGVGFRRFEHVTTLDPSARPGIRRMP